MEAQEHALELERRLTLAVREADQYFKHIGGSSRHWVRECFIPACAQAGVVLDLENGERLIEEMTELGYWCQERTPFFPGDVYKCGFTPHGTTGWNGVPDHWSSGATRLEARQAAHKSALETHLRSLDQE